MRFSSYDNDSIAEFNSGIDYLRLISQLRVLAHQAAIDIYSPDFQEWFAVLEELHSELEPRMHKKDPDSKEEEFFSVKAERLRLAARKYVAGSYSTMGKSVSGREAMRNYFSYLNKFAHRDGLIMRDQDNLPGALKYG